MSVCFFVSAALFVSVSLARLKSGLRQNLLHSLMSLLQQCVSFILCIWFLFGFCSFLSVFLPVVFCFHHYLCPVLFLSHTRVISRLVTDISRRVCCSCRSDESHVISVHTIFCFPVSAQVYTGFPQKICTYVSW